MSGDAQLFDKLHGATMHLAEKYTAPEALHIFELVKGLMQKIACEVIHRE